MFAALSGQPPDWHCWIALARSEALAVQPVLWLACRQAARLPEETGHPLDWHALTAAASADGSAVHPVL